MMGEPPACAVTCAARRDGTREDTSMKRREPSDRGAVLLVAGLVSLAAATGIPTTATGQDATMTPLFAPVNIGADLSALPNSERQALAHIVDAARVMDGIFLEQVWAGNPSMLLSLLTSNAAAKEATLDFFLLNKGPWSRIDENRRFVAGAPVKPDGANFYPAGATRAEIAAWFDQLDGAARTDATGFFTTIRRGHDGGFAVVPYSVEYQGPLAIAAAHLRAASRASAQPTLRHYLESRATAFESNDYYDSDVAWMELDSTIELTIGPYEVYEDEWFNYKAAFEAFVTIRDAAATSNLTRFGDQLQGLEDTLPIDPSFRNPSLGELAPIRVVNVIFTAPDLVSQKLTGKNHTTGLCTMECGRPRQTGRDTYRSTSFYIHGLDKKDIGAQHIVVIPFWNDGLLNQLEDIPFTCQDPV